MGPIDEALGRLNAALSLLEAAVSRRLDADDARGDRETELSLMQEDRARLADELDATRAGLAAMRRKTGEVEARLGLVIGKVEDVLERTAQEGSV